MGARFISIEGVEGAGKSSVIAAVRAFCERAGWEVVVTREPGGSEAGEAIRRILLDPGLHLQAQAELLLMFASRAQLVQELILPALAAGRIVVSDRFTDASFAYQGGGRGLDTGWIAELERRVVGLKPDLTLLLDLPVAEGLARAAARGGEPDRIERSGDDFFERARASYRQRAAAEPERFVLVDASRTPAEVVVAVEAVLSRRIAAR